MARDPRVLPFVRIGLRYGLAFLLLSYGMSRVMPIEFPFPSIARLQERIGDSSPFTLYSVFMGYSAPYTFFTGASAIVASLLLCFRRTTTLGALLVLGVMGNEAMVAFCYDAPTKLLSASALLLALVLLAPDLRRLADGLLFGRPTRPANLAPPFAAGRGRLVRRGLKAAILVSAVLATAKANLDVLRAREQVPRPPLYGAYDVEQFLRNGQARPDIRDRARWRRLIVTSPRELTVCRVDGSRQSFATEYAGQSVALSAAGNVREGTLTYSRPDPDHLLVQGTLAGDSLDLALRKIDEAKYLLVSRKLHVIDDDPLNQ
jgi:hypothetical protein